MYNSWTPPLGNYSLTATPFAASGGTGAAGTPLTLSFSVVDQPTTTGPFPLSVTTSGSGTVGKNPDQATYASGSNVVLTAAAAAGFQFAGWSGSATGTSNPLTVLMNDNKSITATFTAISGGQSVTSYTLVNATTNADIQPLSAGAVLNLATLPTRRLNIRANTSPATVGSVVFALSGAATRNQTESVTPYALFSDNGGVYNSWTPPLGNYSLTATPYTGGGGGGTPGTALTIAFTVTDQAVRIAAAAVSTHSALVPAAVFPNPSRDGHFQVVLPTDFRGEVHYRLVTVLGASVAAGTLTAAADGPAHLLDFSQAMPAIGLYFLVLENQGHTTRLKLTRD